MDRCHVPDICPKSKRWVVIFVIGFVVVTVLTFLTTSVNLDKVMNFRVGSTSVKPQRLTMEEHKPSSQNASAPSSSSLPAPSPERGPDQQVLLVTKGRSGSTFTSELISRDPSVFYNFEPIYSINSRIRGAADIEPHRERVQGILRSYLSCDFMDVLAKDLNNEFHKKTTYGLNFRNCELRPGNGFQHIQCLIDWVKRCHTSRVSFAKVIRVPMRWIEDLMWLLPKLKVIYLIRDPRAMMFSQANNLPALHLNPMTLKESDVKKYCGELKEDTIEIKRLLSLFPGRLQVVRYENGATEMMNYAKDIYDFVGLNFTPKTRDYVDLLRSGPKDNNMKSYGTKKSNGTIVINKWRSLPNAFKVATWIDNLCEGVYSTMGYIKLRSSKDLKDFSYQLFTDPAKFDSLREKMKYS